MIEPDWARARPATPDALGLTRRAQLTGTFAAFVAVALAGEMAVARPARRIAARDWIDRQGELARAFRGGQLTPQAWTVEIGRLAREIDVAELMATVNQAQVTASALPPTNDPRRRTVRFLDEHGEPRRLGFSAALFDFAPANVITPHGHRHMASAHMVVAGRFRVRNFDRLRDEGEAMVVRPTRDIVAAVGTLSTMTSAHDNIHWFVPHGGPARTFDVVVAGLDDGQPDHEIKAIDPLGGRRLGDGSILAPIISFEAASAIYVASV